MISIHTPERLANETQREYRQRQAASRARNDRLALRGQHTAPRHNAPNGRQLNRDTMRQRGMFKGRSGFGADLMAAWARLRVEAKAG